MVVLTVMIWRRGLTAVAAMLVLAGCGRPGAGAGDPVPDPVPEDRGRLEQQAQAALARWEAAAAASGGANPFVPLSDLTDQIGNWEEPVGGNNKIALMTGQLVDKAGLSPAPPAPGRIQWADGRSREVPVLSAAQAYLAMTTKVTVRDCHGCQPLEITDARLSTKDIATSRGKASVPVWEFTIRGTRVIVTRVAVDPSAGITVSPPPWDANNPPAGYSIESATVSADGKHVTAHFTGSGGTAEKPCGADYSAFAVESAHAIVVVVIERPYPGKMAANEACAMIGYPRTAVAELASPLGERAVLEVREGRPVPVTTEPAGK